MLFLSEHSATTKIIGVALGLAGLFVLTGQLGVTNSIFAGFLAWCLLASLMLLFAPFQKIKAQYVGIAFMVLILLEFSAKLL
ncbi:MAG: hypothetical protein AAF944_27680 [Bacteroidota bacterium]